MNDAELHDWIGLLPPDVRDVVVNNMEETALAAGAMLFERNTAPKGLYRLSQGRVRIYFLTECGRELLLKFYSPPESVGDLASVDGQPHAVFAEAQTDCKFQFLSREKLKFLRQKYPAVETGLLNYMTHSVRTVLSLIESTIVFSMQARVAERLHLLAVEAEAHGEQVGTLKISQKDISLMVGASRQAINKALSELQQLDVLKTEYGAIIITDTNRLCEIAEQSMVMAASVKT